MTPTDLAAAARRVLDVMCHACHSTGPCADHCVFLPRVIAELQRLAAEKVAELEEDRARLDWLDQWSTVAHRDGDDYWVVVPIEGAGFSRDETLRAALDAARNPRRLRW